MCEDAAAAGTTEKTIEELKKISLENPDYWLNGEGSSESAPVHYPVSTLYDWLISLGSYGI